MKTIVFRDAVHGDIQFQNELSEVIGTLEFQRLRHIRQNGLLYLVYPNMQHSRFEHSLGTSHLAGKWFDELEMNTVGGRREKFFPLDKDKRFTDGSQLQLVKTMDCYNRIFGDEKATWRMMVQMAALIHDIGHGPLSHSLEKLKILNLSDVEDQVDKIDVIKTFLINRRTEASDDSKKAPVEHEDFTLAYISLLCRASSKLAEFFVTGNNGIIVGAFVHKKFRKFVDEKKLLPVQQIECIKLLGQLISGLFDVDRMDYLKRDSLMAGVKYGNTESERLLNTLVPVLYSKGKETESGMAVRSRFVHTIDHFLVSLYSMYPQVYLHPTNEQYQYELQEIVKKCQSGAAMNDPAFGGIGWHRSASDNSLFNTLNEIAGNNFVNRWLNREFKGNAKVVRQYYSKVESPEEMKDWIRLKPSTRDMIKDGAVVWLIDSKETCCQWEGVSMVALKLAQFSYLPSVWWRNPTFSAQVSQITPKNISSVSNGQDGTATEVRKDTVNK